jgi:hypothetical protein
MTSRCVSRGRCRICNRRKQDCGSEGLFVHSDDVDVGRESGTEGGTVPHHRANNAVRTELRADRIIEIDDASVGFVL